MARRIAKTHAARPMKYMQVDATLSPAIPRKWLWSSVTLVEK
jgi:hypothetical protein